MYNIANIYMLKQKYITYEYVKINLSMYNILYIFYILYRMLIREVISNWPFGQKDVIKE